MSDVPASVRVGRKRCSEGCCWREAGETITASWPGGILASMAGGKDGGGGKAAAVMLPIVCHGFKVLMFEWLDPRQFQFPLEVIGDLAIADTII